MRSGIKCKASELVRDGRVPSLLVLPEWADAAHPQERPFEVTQDEGRPRFPVSPDQTGPDVAAVLAGVAHAGHTSLSWTAATFAAGPRIEEYDVYRDDGTGFELLGTVTVVYSNIGAITGPTLEWTDSTVVSGTAYSYRVTALTNQGIGINSNTVTVTAA